MKELENKIEELVQECKRLSDLQKDSEVLQHEGYCRCTTCRPRYKRDFVERKELDHKIIASRKRKMETVELTAILRKEIDQALVKIEEIKQSKDKRI